MADFRRIVWTPSDGWLGTTVQDEGVNETKTSWIKEKKIWQDNSLVVDKKLQQMVANNLEEWNTKCGHLKNTIKIQFFALLDLQKNWLMQAIVIFFTNSVTNKKVSHGLNPSLGSSIGSESA